MRIPTRKAQRDKQLLKDDGPIYLTKEGHERMLQKLKRLNEALPSAIEDVKRTGEYGDFSENAEYQEAKRHLRSLHMRILSTTEKLTRVQLIEATDQSTVQLGSRVQIDSERGTVTYKLVGPAEANPMQHRISHLSPLGQALLGKKVGDVVQVSLPNGEQTFTITSITI